jgi:DNA invertase Pin-like site-specific DNA recombinase
MRFFGGLGTAEIARALGISSSTVKRNWNEPTAWLTREMEKGDRGNSGGVVKD